MTIQTTLTLEQLQAQVEAWLASNDLSALRELLANTHPADIADLLGVLDEEQRPRVFALLDLHTAAEVLDETQADVTQDLLEDLPKSQVADLLEALPMDDAAELLSELPSKQASELVALMEPEDAAEVRTLLSYEESTAGRLMTEKVVRVRRRWSAQQTIDYLRSVDPETETFASLYVVDDDGRLTGVVPLRRLLTAPPGALIGDLLDPDVISVHVDTDQEDVARLVAKYDFAAIPVVDRQGRLAGIITHDDVVDILEEEFTEDVQRLGGSVPLGKPYLATSTLAVAWKRVGWLLLLFITETLTGSVLRLFEEELSRVVALSFFIPLLIGTGGNAGSQTTSTLIRALATGEVSPRDGLRALWHEVRVGVLLGLVMAAVAYLRALTWGSGPNLALTVALAISSIVLWANLLGSILPLLAERVGVDPTVISGPVMSTLVDATGLFIYFSIAQAVMNI
jgi:magnesium transporter